MPLGVLAFSGYGRSDTDSLASPLTYPRVWPAEYEKPQIPWVHNISTPSQPTQGLLGRHYSVWASHGRYFKQTRWAWQRPYLFCTTEDLLTPSFVYPFLIPMLENAGAVVWTPRERDMQTEMVCLNGPTDETRKKYTWTPLIPKTGHYAVYVRYPQLIDAIPDAEYTVFHSGEKTRIRVNQRMGAETWVYLGNFLFQAGEDRFNKVVLSRQTAYRGHVAAGEVRIGGGMGHIERCAPNDTLAVPSVSGLPHYLEAARYYAEWAGLPDSLYNTEGGLDDYKDDIRTRSHMLNWLARPSEEDAERGRQPVPFELSLAVHTDAGVRKDSMVYGTLTICTTTDEKGRKDYGQLLSREASYDFCQYLMESVERDLGSTYNWSMREIWDRNYSESRVPCIPSAIAELLSHQNFADARLAHDPVFKFRMCRALYKAILRYTYHMHNMESAVVQPLPIRDFAAQWDGGDVILSWSPTLDSLECTATPTHYIIYTKVDDNAFDNGVLCFAPTHRQHLIPGHRYSFRVAAANSGGRSFPSHELALYRTDMEGVPNILLVDAFDRLSGPAFIDTPDSLGFLLHRDMGVPYMRTMEYSGEQLNYDRSTMGGEGAGALGYSGYELIGKQIEGNTFDISSRHLRQILNSDSLFNVNSVCVSRLDCPLLTNNNYHEIHYLAGQQCRAAQNLSDYPVWPVSVRSAIEQHLRMGKELFVYGTYIMPEQLSEEEHEWWKTLEPYTAQIHLCPEPLVNHCSSVEH